MVAQIAQNNVHQVAMLPSALKTVFEQFTFANNLRFNMVCPLGVRVPPDARPFMRRAGIDAPKVTRPLMNLVMSGLDLRKPFLTDQIISLAAERILETGI